MGEAKEPRLVKLIVGMISNQEDLFWRLERVLCHRFGSVDAKSGIMDFSHTTYYEKEMGRGLKRQFLSFSRLIKEEDLAKIKHFTNKLERRFSAFRNRPSRRINLDPGYLSSAKLILATTKDYGHRIYIGRGIYAEVTLHFRDGSFQPWDWTYPDYRTKGYIDFFNQVRKGYLEKIQSQ